jgi:hypothetical protein
LQERANPRYEHSSTAQSASGFSESQGNTYLKNSEYSFGSTSNDLLFKLDPKLPHSYLKYQVIAQNREEVQDIQNAPSISMSTYLTDSAQTQLLTTISVYSQRGESTDQIRLLYMNAVACSVWHDMGKSALIIGSVHRPPMTASLTFGVPFSE